MSAVNESDNPISEVTRGYIALVAAHLGGIDTETFASLAGEVATEGGPNRMSQLLGVSVGMAGDLIHELAITTGRTEEEILQQYAARWAG